MSSLCSQIINQSSLNTLVKRNFTITSAVLLRVHGETKEIKMTRIETRRLVCLFLSLQTLCLDGNHLDCLPEELGSLSQLCSLGLSFNSFPNIPAVLERLGAMDKLAMAGNRVEVLELSSLLRMSHIKSIDLR